MIEAAWYAGLCLGAKDTRCTAGARGICPCVMRNGRERTAPQAGSGRGP